MNKNNKKKELDEKHQKGVLIWSNSQVNKKTYENLFYKKTFDKYVPVREQLIGEKRNSNIMPELNTQQSLKASITNRNLLILQKNIFHQEQYILKIIPKIYLNLE